jgi:hypothetical protein
MSRESSLSHSINTVARFGIAKLKFENWASESYRLDCFGRNSRQNVKLCEPLLRRCINMRCKNSIRLHRNWAELQRTQTRSLKRLTALKTRPQLECWGQ